MSKCLVVPAFTAAAFLVASASPALPQPQSESPIATDRPGNGNAPTTVPPLSWQVEASANYALDDAGPDTTHSISFPTLVRLGLLESFEVRAGSAIVGVDSGSDGATTSTTDTSVGVKRQVLDGIGWTPTLGISVDVFLPSGDGRFTAGTAVPETRVAASWSLPVGLGLLVNAGVDVPDDSGGRYTRFVYVLNVSYLPPVASERVSVFAESFGRVALGTEGSDILQVDAGAALRLGNDWQVDVFSQHALTRNSPDLQIGFGVSTRL